MSAHGLRPLSRARGRCWWSRFPGFRRRSPFMVAQGGGIVKPHPGRRFSARVALPAEIGGAGGWLIPPRRSAGLPMLIAKQGRSAIRSRLHRRRRTTPARAAAFAAAGRSCFAARARTVYLTDRSEGGRSCCGDLHGALRRLALHRWRCCPKWVRGAPTRGSAGAPRRTQRTRNAEGNKRELYFPGTARAFARVGAGHRGGRLTCTRPRETH